MKIKRTTLMFRLFYYVNNSHNKKFAMQFIAETCLPYLKRTTRKDFGGSQVTSCKEVQTKLLWKMIEESRKMSWTIKPSGRVPQSHSQLF